MTSIPPAVGEVFEVAYPFRRDVRTEHYVEEDGAGFAEVPTWIPGVRNEDVGQGVVECFADAMGAQLITVVGVYRPGRFPTRVFFERQWRDPDGKVFGKSRCRQTTVSAFRNLTRGFRVPFELVAPIRSER